jgi:hypothetical protein
MKMGKSDSPERIYINRGRRRGEEEIMIVEFFLFCRMIYIMSWLLIETDKT